VIPPSWTPTEKRTKDRFISALYKYGISNISFVFNEEMVLAPDREMPWRARVTLSRMKKELKMIPFFQKMSGQELQTIRKRLLEDAIRPLRSTELIYSVVQNSDLASTPENREEVIEDVLVTFLPSIYFVGTTKVLSQGGTSISRSSRKRITLKQNRTDSSRSSSFDSRGFQPRKRKICLRNSSATNWSTLKISHLP